MATDPLSLVYDKMWDMLEAHTGFTDLVTIANRIKFSGQVRSPKRFHELLTADRPAVGITATGAKPHVDSSSSSTFLEESYQLVVVTGDQRVTKELYPVTWEMFRAMTGWQSQLVTLQWNGKPFVKRCRPEGSTEGVMETETHGIRGWVGRWHYTVFMSFTTADLHP